MIELVMKPKMIKGQLVPGVNIAAVKGEPIAEAFNRHNLNIQRAKEGKKVRQPKPDKATA